MTSEAEKAAAATREAIRRMMKPKHRQQTKRVIGERVVSDLDDMWEAPEPVVYNRKDRAWQNHRWASK